MDAVQSVFATEELLESIFFNLDIRSIITSVQRVCKQWHRSVTTSVAVQRHLYFLPEPLPNSNHKSNRRLNPLLSELFQPWFQHAKDPATLFDHSQLEGQTAGMSTEDLNDFKKYLRDTDKFDNARRRFGETALYACGEDPDSPWRRAGATWRNMLVAQPPVTKIGVFQRPNLSLEMSCGRRWEVISNGDIEEVVQTSPDATSEADKRILMSPFGPRMGELYHEILRRVRWMENAGFEILHGVQEVTRDEFLSRLGTMHYDSCGEGGSMYDAGAELVLLVHVNMDGMTDFNEMLRLPFWRRCCGVDDPGLEAAEREIMAAGEQWPFGQDRVRTE